MLVPSLKQRAPGWIGPGRRVYAVGDVHGCADRLDALHALVAADLAARPVALALLIHLGDMIDRGPDSAGVIRRLAGVTPVPGTQLVSLRGNHEQMMLDAMTGDPDALDNWRINGGDLALRSWGITRPKRNKDWPSMLPSEDAAFVAGLQLTHAVDGYLFVHAGVRPGTKLVDQVLDDLLWIRRPFLTSSGPLLPEAPGVAVVHGHTPDCLPIVTDNRVGVDTGAVRGGALTCAILEGRDVSFIAV